MPKSELEFYRKLRAEQKTQTNAQRVQGGDPYIEVDAPPDTARVVALFPDGRTMALERDPATGHFRAQFDIPYLTPEGDYVVTLILVSENGKRRRVRLVYRVDRTPPDGTPTRLCATPGGQVEVSLSTDSEVGRVDMLTPWGDRRPLKLDGDRWGGTLSVPRETKPATHFLRFILTDRAHNQTIVTTDLVVRPDRGAGSASSAARPQ